MSDIVPMTAEQKALVDNNIGLAMFLYQLHLRKFQRKADYNIDPNDLMSEALYGLVRAAIRYRPYGEEKGYSEESIATGQYFSVFARKSITGQMLDFLRKIDHVHTLVRKDYKNLVDKGLGSSMKTDEELASESELSPERMQKVINLVHSKPVYLDDLLHGATEQTVGENLHDASTVESTALEASLREALVQGFDRLSPLQQTIVALKYYLNQELPDIAELTGQKLSQIRKNHTEALLEMHSALVHRVLGA